MEIDGMKYVYVMKPNGKSQLIPVPKPTAESKVIETQVEVNTLPPPTPESAKVPSPPVHPVTPTVLASVPMTSTSIYATLQTSVSAIGAVSPPIETMSKATDGVMGAGIENNVTDQSTTDMGGSTDTVSLMVSNKSFLCTMVMDVMGYFYLNGQKELVVFPQKASLMHYNFLPKMQPVNVKLNMPCSLMQKLVSSWIQGLLPAESSKK